MNERIVTRRFPGSRADGSGCIALNVGDRMRVVNDEPGKLTLVRVMDNLEVIADERVVLEWTEELKNEKAGSCDPACED